MYTTFDKIADSARIWIYQADRPMNEDEKQILKKGAIDFCNQWVAHNNALETSADIRYDQFLILAVDESKYGASGCSIDSSVAFIKQAEQALSINFFDRTKIAFKESDKIILTQLQKIKSKVEEGELTPDTITFNNLIASKSEINTHWEVPLKDSWLKKYLE